MIDPSRATSSAHERMRQPDQLHCQRSCRGIATTIRQDRRAKTTPPGVNRLTLARSSKADTHCQQHINLQRRRDAKNQHRPPSKAQLIEEPARMSDRANRPSQSSHALLDRPEETDSRRKHSDKQRCCFSRPGRSPTGPNPQRHQIRPSKHQNLIVKVQSHLQPRRHH